MSRTHTSPSGPDLNYRWMTAVMRMLCAAILDGKMDVTGAENVPRSGGLLVVSNHIGTIDPPFTGAQLPRRDLYFMAKSDYFRTPVARFFIVGYHAFPVVRGTPDRAALRQALGLLHQGHAVLVYPEGHRSPDGRLQRPHPGAGLPGSHRRGPGAPGGPLGNRGGPPAGLAAAPPGARPPPLRRAGPAPGGAGGRPRASHQEIADLLMQRIAEVLPASRRGIFDGATDYRSVPPPAA